MRALSQLGFGSLGISASDLTVTGKVIQLGYEPNRIDLMTSVTGVSFDDAWDDRAPGDLDGLPSTSSAGCLSSATRTLLVAPKTASMPRNSGSRVRQPSFQAVDGRDAFCVAKWPHGHAPGLPCQMPAYQA